MQNVYGYIQPCNGVFIEIGLTERGAKTSATKGNACNGYTCDLEVGYRSSINNMFIKTAVKTGGKWHAVTVETVTLSDDQIMEKAAEIIEANYATEGVKFTNSRASMRYCQMHIGAKEHEVFGVLFLNSQHDMIQFREMFQGTINGSSVHCREVVKVALQCNAAAVILTHNHPSGDPTPSNSDIAITKKLKDILSVIDVNVLDHIVVGRTCYSMANSGLI